MMCDRFGFDARAGGITTARKNQNGFSLIVERQSGVCARNVGRQRDVGTVGEQRNDLCFVRRKHG